MSKVRAHVRIWGQVQGVFFRSTARQLADAEGVTGWIANRPDGSVEAVFEGEQPQVEALVQWCHIGPPQAWVERVDTSWEPYTGQYTRFSVR